MFERRHKLSFPRKFAQFFWPNSGFRRASKYILHRLSRLPGTPYTLAAGFACGAAVSFTPFVGLHFILAAILAWIIRADILASAIGTAVGNPWTFPFIWVWLYNLGHWLGFGEEGVDVTELDFARLFGQLGEALLKAEYQTVIDLSAPVLWPMFIAGIPTAALVWCIFYFPLRRIVRIYQHRRVERRLKKLKKQVEEQS